MKKWLSLVVSFWVGAVQAEAWPGYVQFAVATSSPEAHRKADLSTVFAWEALGGYRLNDALSAELRVASFSGAKDRGADNVGTYTLSLATVDTGLGLRWQSQPYAEQFRAVVRGGLLRYRVDAELKESFYDLREAGKTSTLERGMGGYVGAGVDVKHSDHIKLLGVVYYTVRRDVFDDSPRSFHLRDWRMGVGMQYLF